VPPAVTHITNPMTNHEWGEDFEDCDYDTLNISVIICDIDRYTEAYRKISTISDQLGDIYSISM
jgi:vacuolar-type H+-ATPase subunit B/Vma2